MVNFCFSLVAPLTVAFAALSVTEVQAHGWLVKPKAEFVSGAGDITQYSAVFLGTSVYSKGSFSGSPSDNVKSFSTNFKDGQFSNIKSMILKNQKVKGGATAECGFSKVGTKQALGSTVWWGKNTDLTGEGFVESHEGPCEAWCDNTMVMQNLNCAKAYNKAGKAAEVPIDSSKCSGASRFTFYWIAMHTNEWQVYINCLALGGSGGGAPAPASGGANSAGNSGSVTPSATTSTTTTNNNNNGNRNTGSSGVSNGGNSWTWGNIGSEAVSPGTVTPNRGNMRSRSLD